AFPDNAMSGGRVRMEVDEEGGDNSSSSLITPPTTPVKDKKGQSSPATTTSQTSSEAPLSFSPEDIRAIILGYLVHNCYIETAKAFISACNMEKEGNQQLILIEERKRVLEMARSGEIRSAIELTSQLFPS